MGFAGSFSRAFPQKLYSPQFKVNRFFMSSSTTATRTKFVFEPHPTPSVAVLGDDGELKFPVHRIYCVGRNYADHVKEMGGDSNLDKPVFFCKPADAVVVSGTSIPYPLATKNLHYEAELVIALQSGGKSIPVDQALKHVYGYAVGIDLTRRDLQAIAKEKGQPWDSAKAFDLSAPIGPITVGPNSVKDDAKISLEVNKVQKQSSTIDKMIYSIPEIISILSEEFLLQAGDLIFTGTPSGVGKLEPGDTVKASVEGLDDVELTIERS